MKNIQRIVTTSFVALLLACNNGDQTSNNTDSTSAGNSTNTEATTPIADSSNSSMGSDLMQPMNQMMSRMQGMQMTGDFDIDFANMMIEHHQSALDMARIELANGKDETMKAKAQEILDKQGKSQQELRDFVKNYKPSGMKHGEGELQKAMSQMQSHMQGMKPSGDIDKDFASMMSQHHQDGITMAKMEVKNGMSNELKKMAQKEIDDQQKDINNFKSWLNSN